MGEGVRWLGLGLLLLCVSETLGTSRYNPRCPTGWLPRAGSNFCYKFYSRSAYSWSEAESYCEARGGTLATIEEKAERIFLAENAAAEFYHIGLQYNAAKQWLWVDGKPCTFSAVQWNAGQPSSTRMPNCAMLDTKTSKLSDTPCDGYEANFVCKRSVNAAEFCPYGWTQVGQRCYRLLTGRHSFDFARTRMCPLYGGQMLTVQNSAEAQYVLEALDSQRQTKAWIGLKDTGYQNWTWVTPTHQNATVGVDPSSYWGVGEPKYPAAKPNATYCAAAWLSDGKWHAQACNSFLSYVCERPTVGCAYYWAQYGQQCFQFNRDYASYVPWDSANGICASQNASLMHITSQGMNTWLGRSTRQYYWMGMSDECDGLHLDDGNFKWCDDGTAVWDQYENFYKNKTTNTPNKKDCGFLDGYSTFSQWHLADCTRSHYFVCQSPVGSPVTPATQKFEDFYCPSGWQKLGSRCYWFVSDQATWVGATTACSLNDSVLTDITHADEQSFVNAQMSETYWTGLNDRQTEGYYVWRGKDAQHYTPLSKNKYRNWAPNQPQGGAGNCVSVKLQVDQFGNHFGYWADTLCSNSASYVCEKDAYNSKTRPTLPPHTTPWPTQCGPYWEFEKVSGYCYKAAEERNTWADARSACQEEAGDLASLHGVAEMSTLSLYTDKFFGAHLKLWIGASDRSVEGGWTWSDGSAFNYLNWNVGEPNNAHGGEDCAEMYSDSGVWNDQDCADRNLYVCKKFGGDPSTTAASTTLPTQSPGQFWGCPAGWTAYGNNCYMQVDTRKSQHDALVDCRKRGGDLASVHSADENSFLVSVTNHVCIFLKIKGQNYASGPTIATTTASQAHCQVACDSMKSNCGGYTYQASTSVCRLKGVMTGAVADADYTSYLRYCQTHAWIGLTDLRNEATFVWTDATPTSYTAWARGEPNAYSDKEDCIEFYAENGGWNDLDCSELRPYICKMPKSVQPAPTGPPTSSGCQAGVAWQSSCYLFVDSTPKSAHDAQMYCKTNLGGGHLIGVDDVYESAFLTSSLGSHTSGHFIGLQYVHGAYLWTDNQPVSFTNWAQNYPDSSQGTCVAASAGTLAGLWSNADCAKPRPFVCEAPRSGFTQPSHTTSTVDPTSVCPDGWQKVPGGPKCYRAFRPSTGMTWAEARASCKALTANVLGGGGELASIPDAATNALLVNKVSFGVYDSHSYWIGLNSLGGGTEAWSDRSPVAYTKWGSGQPNHGTQAEYHCVSFIPSNGGSWYETNCANVKGWICEVPTGSALQTTTVGPSPTPPRNCPATPEQGGLPWFVYNSTCYWLSGSRYSDLMTWQAARKFCQSQSNSELASIHSLDEQNFLITSMQKSGFNWNVWWIGLSQLTSKDASFAWSDGTFVDYQYWNAGEPNNFGVSGESCTELYRNGKWNDAHCSTKAPFVCKHDPHRKPFTTPAPVSGNCPQGWIHTSSMCYKYFGDKRNFTSARDQCRLLAKSQGAIRPDLASIPDHHVQTALVAGMADLASHVDNLSNGYWIGLSDADREQRFRWTDNSEYAYANWDGGEPNGNWYHDEDCVMMYTGRTLAGRWNDWSCAHSIGYVCQAMPDPKAKPPPPPTGCAVNYTKSGQNCYKVLAKPDTWAKLEATCKADGSGFTHLAFPNSVYEDAFLQTWLTKLDRTNLYIGMNDQDSTHTYEWSSGWPVLYSNWGPGEPTALAGQGCVTINNYGVFQDQNCSMVFSGVCQYSLSTPPTVQPSAYCQKYDMCPITVHGISWVDAGGCYCYWADPDNTYTQANAHKQCLELDADLVSIRSQAENDFVQRTMGGILGGKKSIWLGLLQSKVTGGFKWTDGHSLTYTDWNKGEPNNWNNQEDCAEMYTGSGKWNDLSCEASNLAVVCKAHKVRRPKPTFAPDGYCGGDKRWPEYKGNCYYFARPSWGVSGDHPLTWAQAQARCVALDSAASLASIHTQDENDWIDKAINQHSSYYNTHYWLGLSELDQKGIYKWKDGSLVNFENWKQGEPNDYKGGESCVELYAKSSPAGLWNDQHCGLKDYYICKKGNGTTAAPPTTPPLPKGNCPYGWLTFPRSPKCYKPFNNPVNWTQAEANCRQQGSPTKPGHLVSVHSQEEQSFLIAMMPSYHFTSWIGLTDTRRERQFLWRDETDYDFANWAAGEPNGRYWGGYQEDCVEMYYSENHAGQWNDLSCGYHRGYICTIPKDPNLPSPPPPPKGNCTKDGESFFEYGKACYSFSKKADTRDASEAACQKLDPASHLMSVQSVYEEAFLTTLMLWNQNTEGVWTGLKRDGGVFKWSNGWPVYYTDWADEQPTEGKNDVCVAALAKDGGQWSDTTCSSPYFSICKRNLQPKPVQPTAYPGICPTLSSAKYKYLDGGSDKCFLFVTHSAVSFADAHINCLSKKGNMASIHSQADNDFVAYVMQKSGVSGNLWLGLLRMDGGSFGWVDGSATDYTNWASGEPNFYKNQEYCGEMYISGQWNDVLCSTPRGYICSTRKIPLNETTPAPAVTTVFPWKPHTRGHGPNEMATPAYGLPAEGVTGMVLLGVVAVIVAAVVVMLFMSRRGTAPSAVLPQSISVASSSVADAAFDNPNSE